MRNSKKNRGSGGDGEPCERTKFRGAKRGGSNRVRIAAIDGKPSASTRWMPHSLFPRFLDQRSLLTMNIRYNTITHGGEVVGSLDTSPSSLSLGIIAKEWGAWLIALRFVPLTTTCIWIFDPTWEKLLCRLFPTVILLDGLHSSLPPVHILLLSKVTLTPCNINLQTCPASLILSTSRLRVSRGWQYNY